MFVHSLSFESLMKVSWSGSYCCWPKWLPFFQLRANMIDARKFDLVWEKYVKLSYSGLRTRTYSIQWWFHGFEPATAGFGWRYSMTWGIIFRPNLPRRLHSIPPLVPVKNVLNGNKPYTCSHRHGHLCCFRMLKDVWCRIILWVSSNISHVLIKNVNFGSFVY